MASASFKIVIPVFVCVWRMVVDVGIKKVLNVALTAIIAVAVHNGRSL